MHKIDHVTATAANEFTDGDPQTGVKPTVVTPEWLTTIQNEIANFITSTGIVLNKADNTQLTQALSNLKTINDKNFTILNNQANTLMGAEFEFDLATIKSAIIECDLYRKDATQEKTCVGYLYLIGKPIAGTFELVPKLTGDEEDVGVVFGVDMVDTVAKVKYSTTNFIGANYEGKLVFKITKFKR